MKRRIGDEAPRCGHRPCGRAHPAHGGHTNTLPLHVEILYNEYNFVGAFAVASLLALLGLVTLVVKSALEWRYADALAARHRH